jgi:hypothetical protein
MGQTEPLGLVGNLVVEMVVGEVLVIIREVQMVQMVVSQAVVGEVLVVEMVETHQKLLETVAGVK